jgi:hypothetical protein
MKNLIFLLFGLCLSLTSLTAQSDQTLFGNSGMRLSGAWGGWNVGLTAFDDDFAVTRGGFGGLEFGKNVFVGWGGFETTDQGLFGSSSNSRFDLDYTGLMLGYNAQSHKVIHPQFLLMIGGGEATIANEGSDNVFVLQPGAGVEVNIFRWFRLGLDGGYRFVTDTDLPNLKDTDLSAFYGQVRFKFGFSWGR